MFLLRNHRQQNNNNDSNRTTRARFLPHRKTILLLIFVGTTLLNTCGCHKLHFRYPIVCSFVSPSPTTRHNGITTTTTPQTRHKKKVPPRSPSAFFRLHESTNNDNNYNDNILLTQVVSDVDDTLKSSGGVNVAGVALGGIDVQYARGEIYPGVAQFMLEVSRAVATNNNNNPAAEGNYGGGGGAADDNTDAAVTTAASPEAITMTTTTTPPKIAILTARAEEFKAALKLDDSSKLGKEFKKVGEKAGIPNWGLGPVLYGSVAEWIVQNRKGLRKFTNFERLLQQDPTGTIFQYIYVGDTGELDQEAGETMLREYPEVVKAVFLHFVRSEPGDVPAVPPPRFINGRPIVFFRTYVGAGIAAVQLGLISPDALLRIIDSAKQSLRFIPGVSDKWIDMDRDITRAYNTIFN